MYSLLRYSLFRGHVSFGGCTPCIDHNPLILTNPSHDIRLYPIMFAGKASPQETREQQLKGENSTLQEEVRGVSVRIIHWDHTGKMMEEIPKQPAGMVKTI